MFRFPHSQQSSVSSSTSTNPQTSHTLCVMENTAEGPNHLRNTSVCCGERIISKGDKMDKQKVKNNIEKQTVNKAMQRQRWTDRKTARQSQTVCHSLTTADLETADKTPTTCHSFQIQRSWGWWECGDVIPSPGSTTKLDRSQRRLLATGSEIHSQKPSWCFIVKVYLGCCCHGNALFSMKQEVLCAVIIVDTRRVSWMPGGCNFNGSRTTWRFRTSFGCCR